MLHLIEHKKHFVGNEWSITMLNNSAVYKNNNYLHMGAGCMAGGCNFCLAFYFLQSGEKGASLCPSKLALHLQYECKK